jgi:large subunit ribosomal protein L24
MKRKFSTHWKSSKQPRKQRKYIANAPLHIKRKLMSVNLSKELRKKYQKRSVPLRKKDTVKIMRGKFKGKKGKIIKVLLKTQKVEVEGIQIKKQDGSKVNIKLRPSNLQIIELNVEDKKRNKALSKGIKEKKQEKNVSEEHVKKTKKTKKESSGDKK